VSTDPAVQHPSARNSGRKLADVLGTIVLLVAHFLLFGATIVLLGLLVMMTDPCGYQKCGEPAWLDRAMNLDLWDPPADESNQRYGHVGEQDGAADAVTTPTAHQPLTVSGGMALRGT
jgi:hypothetical protein